MFYIRTYIWFTNAIVSIPAGGRPINACREIFIQVVRPSLLVWAEVPYNKYLHIYMVYCLFLVGYNLCGALALWSVKLQISLGQAAVWYRTLGSTFKFFKSFLSCFYSTNRTRHHWGYLDFLKMITLPSDAKIWICCILGQKNLNICIYLLRYPSSKESKTREN